MRYTTKGFIVALSGLLANVGHVRADTCNLAAVSSATGYLNLGGTGDDSYDGFIWQHGSGSWQSIDPTNGNGSPGDYHYDCKSGGSVWFVDPRGVTTAMCIICNDKNGLCLPGGHWNCQGNMGQAGNVYVNSAFAGIADGVQTVCEVQYEC